MRDRRPAPGTVYLVGAGPGDPGLLTLRGAECLGKADLVLHDYLANPALLERARPGAELVRLGHHADGRSLEPDGITARMIAEARAGRTVVRLKGGDPSIFGRGGDEADALRAAGIPFEIVPGITAGLSVAAFAEIPLTHHEDASAVALVTARERTAKGEPRQDYAALAAFPGTLVFYMGVKEVGEWSGALLAQGKPAATPVAVVRWASRARQQTVRCTLETVARVVGERGLRPPCLFVVGKVVDRAPRLSWFEARPLFGTTVLVAGSAPTAAKLRERLSERGAEVVAQPAIRIVGPPDPAAVDAALEGIRRYDGLVFSSPNGVDGLVRRLFERGKDVRGLAGVRLVALGAGTAEALDRFHLRADLAPERVRSGSFARTLVLDRGGKRFLLARAADDRPALAAELRAAGALVDEVAVYGTRGAEEPDPFLLRALSEGEIHWAAVTSAPTARSLVRLYGEALRGVSMASLSPLTSEALAELGHPPAVEAAPHTLAGLVEAIVGAAAAREPGEAPGPSKRPGPGDTRCGAAAAGGGEPA